MDSDSLGPKAKVKEEEEGAKDAPLPRVQQYY